MMTLRSRDKAALGVVATVLAVVAFFFLVINPQLSKVSNLSGQIASQKRTLIRDESAYQAGRAAQISLHMNRADWASVRRAVPVTADIPGLLRLLQNNSTDSRVELQSVAMTGNGGASGSSSAASLGTSTVPTVGGAAEIPVGLTFYGGYSNLEQLARQLDHLVVDNSSNGIHSTGPLVTIGSVSFTGKPHDLEAQLTATIYEQPAVQATDTSTSEETTTP